jgi:hypothetical protein
MYSVIMLPLLGKFLAARKAAFAGGAAFIWACHDIRQMNDERQSKQQFPAKQLFGFETIHPGAISRLRIYMYVCHMISVRPFSPSIVTD